MIHRLTCAGCGTALPPEQGRRGSLRRLHPECRLVRHTWTRLIQTTQRLARYRRVTEAGAGREMAQWACTSQTRTEAALDAFAEISIP